MWGAKKHKMTNRQNDKTTFCIVKERETQHVESPESTRRVFQGDVLWAIFHPEALQQR